MKTARARVSVALALALSLSALLAGCIRDNAVGPAGPQLPGNEPGIIYTVAGNGFIGVQDDVIATESPLYFPVKPFVDDDGSIIFIDWNNHRIRKIDPNTYVITTIANKKGVLGDDPAHGVPGAPGTIAPAIDCALNHPTAIIRHGDDLVIAAWHNHRIKVIHPNGLMQTISGSSEIFGSFSGDTGKSYLAQHSLPSSVAYDDSGNYYVSDQGNFRIRKINPDSIITTYAGNFDFIGFDGDGGDALNAKFNAPKGADAVPCWRLVFDKVGNNRYLYIADSHNNRVRVIDVNTHIITTFAGNGPLYPNYTAEITGDGGPATDASLWFPTDVAIGPDHSVYICDSYHNAIRRVKNGIITTVAGNGQQGYSGDGGLATEATLNHPNGIWVDKNNVLYIADTENQRVRRVRIPE
jgi:hypothetical protein